VLYATEYEWDSKGDVTYNKEGPVDGFDPYNITLGDRKILN
jgi:hypothetical protein